MFRTLTSQFCIKVKGARLEIKKGTVPDYFLREIRIVSRMGKALNGKIYGVNKNGMIALEFSHSIPEFMQQRLRNVWKQPRAKDEAKDRLKM